MTDLSNKSLEYLSEVKLIKDRLAVKRDFAKAFAEREFISVGAKEESEKLTKEELLIANGRETRHGTAANASNKKPRLEKLDIDTGVVSILEKVSARQVRPENTPYAKKDIIEIAA